MTIKQNKHEDMEGLQPQISRSITKEPDTFQQMAYYSRRLSYFYGSILGRLGIKGRQLQAGTELIFLLMRKENEGAALIADDDLSFEKNITRRVQELLEQHGTARRALTYYNAESKTGHAEEPLHVHLGRQLPLFNRRS